MSTLHHPRRNRLRQADRTRRRLRLRRCNNLHNKIPRQLHIRIGRLSVVRPTWRDNEAVICVHVAIPISGVAHVAPLLPTPVPGAAVVISISMSMRWLEPLIVEQVRDIHLPPSPIRISKQPLLRHSVVCVRRGVRSLAATWSSLVLVLLPRGLAFSRSGAGTAGWAGQGRSTRFDAGGGGSAGLVAGRVRCDGKGLAQVRIRLIHGRP